MASPFAWRDFGKKSKDLHSKYFPAVGKTGNLEDSVSVKVSSKAQKGVEFESKVQVVDQSKTNAEFSAKLAFEQLEGVKFEVKGKNKPAEELKVKFTDKLIPVEGLEVAVKAAAQGKDVQTVAGLVAYKNEMVNLNLALTLPVTKKVVDFLADPTEEGNPLENQKVNVATDFVVKPMEDNYYLGVNANLDVKKDEADDQTYQVQVAVGYQVDDFVGAVYYDQKQEKKKEGEGVDLKKKVGGSAYTQVDDVEVSGHVAYCFNKKQVELSAAAGLQRDKDSKVSLKAKVLPNPTVSLGYNQKLNQNVKVNFGYAFLLAQGEEKKKASAFSFGLELSH